MSLLRPPGAMTRAATTVLTLFCLPEWMVDDKGNRYHHHNDCYHGNQEIDIFTPQCLAKAWANGFPGLLPTLLSAFLLALDALLPFPLSSHGRVLAIWSRSQVLHATAHLAAVALGLPLSRAGGIHFPGLCGLRPWYRCTANAGFVALTGLPALADCGLIFIRLRLLPRWCFHLSGLWRIGPAFARFWLVRFCHDCILPCLRSIDIFLFDERPGYSGCLLFIIGR